jgi:putative transcriptional regulator
MKKNLFAELLDSAQDALEHAQGKRELRTTLLPSPPKPMTARDVRRLRDNVNASQAVFASFLNVSTKLVQAWESDRRAPEGAALKLLRLAEESPDLVFSRGARTNRRFAAMKKAGARKVAKKAARKRSA